MNEDGWQQPRRVAAPQAVIEQPPVSNTNRYGALANLPQPALEQNPSDESKALSAKPTDRKEPASQPRHSRPKSQRDIGVQLEQSTRIPEADLDKDIEERETSLKAQQVYDRPHQASYFIPG